jgi:hypothetical protein
METYIFVHWKGQLTLEVLQVSGHMQRYVHFDASWWYRVYLIYHDSGFCVDTTVTVRSELFQTDTKTLIILKLC